ncbi:hypothetical protein ACOME3_004131 [Neoechinorhynchus agilis]
MLMPKSHIQLIQKHLFSDGVMVARKDLSFDAHETLGLPNIHVIKVMQSLVSRGYVRETFAWQHYYWYLKDEGITYLRQQLHLSPLIVPETLKKVTAPDSGGAQRGAFRTGPPRGDYGKDEGPGRHDIQFASKYESSAPTGTGSWRK